MDTIYPIYNGFNLAGGDELSYLYRITHCYGWGGRLTEVLLYRQGDLAGQGGFDDMKAPRGARAWKCYCFGEESHGLSVF